METESFEFELSQYLDGDLPAEKRAEIELRLRSDPAARAMLEDFRKLDSAARAMRPMPEIAWDELANNISRAVASETRRPAVFVMPWLRAGLALAAAILVVFGVAQFWPSQPAVPQAVLVVVGPQAELPAGPSAIDVSVSRPDEPQTAAVYSSENSVLVRPSIVALDGFTNQSLIPIH
jgi:anti-sigma factor RsiW